MNRKKKKFVRTLEKNWVPRGTRGPTIIKDNGALGGAAGGSGGWEGLVRTIFLARGQLASFVPFGTSQSAVSPLAIVTHSVEMPSQRGAASDGTGVTVRIMGHSSATVLARLILNGAPTRNNQGIYVRVPA